MDSARRGGAQIADGIGQRARATFTARAGFRGPDNRVSRDDDTPGKENRTIAVFLFVSGGSKWYRPYRVQSTKCRAIRRVDQEGVCEQNQAILNAGQGFLNKVVAALAGHC